MFKNRTPLHSPEVPGGKHPTADPALPSTSLEKAEKGSHRPMWELLLEMRVLLPYLARLVPLLDRGLSKASPDLTDLRAGIVEMQTGSSDLEVQARNQALQLERIEQQMARLRVVHENSIEETRKLATDMKSLRRLVLTFASVIVLLLLASVGMAAFMLVRP
jgi:hypothetical protein